MFKLLRRWLKPDIAPVRESVYMKELPGRKAERPWTGAGSGTEAGILHHLQYGPMTRKQLDAVLDVTTAGLLLPRMVDRRQIRIVRGTWPFLYERTTTADDAVDPVVGAPT